MSCDVGDAMQGLENEAEPHSPTLPPLYPRHSSFYSPSVASPTSQLIPQPLRRFPHVTAHSTALPWLQLRHRHFTYVTSHSPTLPPFHLRHSLFSNPSAASSTPQLIFQHFRRFTYVTSHSTTFPLFHLRHRNFTWRAAHA